MTDPLDKPSLRAHLLVQRKTLAADHPDAGALAAACIHESSLTPVGILAAYTKMGSEVDCTFVAARFAVAGWRIAQPTNAQKRYKFHTGNMFVWPDVIVAPLVGFDTAGHRLGRGGGWYDRAIAAVRAVKPCTVIGLAYSGQQVDAIPNDPHDICLNAILTERGFWTFPV